MISIGQTNVLEVTKVVDFGVYLEGDELGEILLPKKEVPKDLAVGDLIEVFLYLDSEDRFIATLEKPKAMVGQVAFLKTAAVTGVGAFLDWGLPKDLLVPFREQLNKMSNGRSYLVYIYVDSLTHRIVASSKINKFLNLEPFTGRIGEPVNLIVSEHNDIGFSVVINHTHTGILYENEVFQKLHVGQHIQGYIKKIREDGKIDCQLHKPGYDKVDDSTEKILKALQDNEGFLNVNDKSSPDRIYGLLGISKKTFKMTIGSLYKKRIIAIEDNGIRLLPKPAKR